VVGGRVAGAHLPRLAHGPVVAALVLVPFGSVWYLADGAGWERWGGMMLNAFMAVVAILLCFPLGVLAALGRRSSLPVVSGVSTVYIELFRGAPLFVLLLMANVALRFFVPEDLAPGQVVRAIVVFTLFTGAYVAEIVRGGLQSLPVGQTEAGRALGLSPVRITFWIVLPQALRNVIPAQVGQFISLFKDTTLAGAAMGVFDLLRVGEAITRQGPFAGQALLPETFAFVGLLFWVGSFTMSRESQRIERKLGVGTR
jgi:general L-amino acid transport system permease protein